MPRGKPLSALELEVLELVAQGRSAREIGTMLFRTTKAVEHRKERMMKKLGITGDVGLTLYWQSLHSHDDSTGGSGD